MPKQYTPITSTIKFDCVSLCEMNVGQRCIIQAGWRPVSSVVHEPGSVTSDVQATVTLPPRVTLLNRGRTGTGVGFTKVIITQDSS